MSSLVTKRGKQPDQADDACEEEHGFSKRRRAEPESPQETSTMEEEEEVGEDDGDHHLVRNRGSPRGTIVEIDLQMPTSDLQLPQTCTTANGNESTDLLQPASFQAAPSSSACAAATSTGKKEELSTKKVLTTSTSREVVKDEGQEDAGDEDSAAKKKWRMFVNVLVPSGSHDGPPNVATVRVKCNGIPVNDADSVSWCVQKEEESLSLSSDVPVEARDKSATQEQMSQLQLQEPTKGVDEVGQYSVVVSKQDEQVVEDLTLGNPSEAQEKLQAALHSSSPPPCCSRSSSPECSSSSPPTTSLIHLVGRRLEELFYFRKNTERNALDWYDDAGEEEDALKLLAPCIPSVQATYLGLPPDPNPMMSQPVGNGRYELLPLSGPYRSQWFAERNSKRMTNIAPGTAFIGKSIRLSVEPRSRPLEDERGENTSNSNYKPNDRRTTATVTILAFKLQDGVDCFVGVPSVVNASGAERDGSTIAIDMCCDDVQKVAEALLSAVEEDETDLTSTGVEGEHEQGLATTATRLGLQDVSSLDLLLKLPAVATFELDGGKDDSTGRTCQTRRGVVATTTSSTTSSGTESDHANRKQSDHAETRKPPPPRKAAPDQTRKLSTSSPSSDKNIKVKDSEERKNKKLLMWDWTEDPERWGAMRRSFSEEVPPSCSTPEERAAIPKTLQPGNYKRPKVHFCLDRRFVVVFRKSSSSSPSSSANHTCSSSTSTSSADNTTVGGLSGCTAQRGAKRGTVLGSYIGGSRRRSWQEILPANRDINLQSGLQCYRCCLPVQGMPTLEIGPKYTSAGSPRYLWICYACFLEYQETQRVRNSHWHFDQRHDLRLVGSEEALGVYPDLLVCGHPWCNGSGSDLIDPKPDPDGRGCRLSCRKCKTSCTYIPGKRRLPVPLNFLSLTHRANLSFDEIEKEKRRRGLLR
ncbi:unnamed protein product [Amoebophrya sp. A25]|nr:unnamed protein product [Amoebophrya sp. A25]|eukprot:GSA25T00020429001.1